MTTPTTLTLTKNIAKNAKRSFALLGCFSIRVPIGANSNNSHLFFDWYEWIIGKFYLSYTEKLFLMNMFKMRQSSMQIARCRVKFSFGARIIWWTSQELWMLPNVTLFCQVTITVCLSVCLSVGVGHCYLHYQTYYTRWLLRLMNIKAGGQSDHCTMG